MFYSQSISFINTLFSRVNASKRIRREPEQIENLIIKLFEYIDLFNSLDEDQDRVLEVNYDRIPVIKELADFIIPRSVRYDSNDKRGENLLQLSLVKTASSNQDQLITSHGQDVNLKGHDIDEVIITLDYYNMTINKFIDLQSEFRGLFKKDITSDIIMLSDIKKDVNLSDVIKRMSCPKSIDGKSVYYCQYNGLPYIPIRLNGTNGLYKSSYFNETENAILDDYIIELKF